jgi:hypothetical protein
MITQPGVEKRTGMPIFPYYISVLIVKLNFRRITFMEVVVIIVRIRIRRRR